MKWGNGYEGGAEFFPILSSVCTVCDGHRADYSLQNMYNRYGYENTTGPSMRTLQVWVRREH